MPHRERSQQESDPRSDESAHALLSELVTHLDNHRADVCQEWAERIIEQELLSPMTEEEVFGEVTAVFDQYVEALETGTFESLQAYARNLSERIIPRGVETDEVMAMVLQLRDIAARSLCKEYSDDIGKFNRLLNVYEPAANRISTTVAISFVEERERIITEQQEAIRELSTPVLKLRDQLLIQPIVGAIDPPRARQLTEDLLHAIRATRGKVVVIDFTGVPSVDASIANSLVQTVEASRLLGASVIVSGISPSIAQTLVEIGVDLGQMNTVGDLQGGIEMANRLLGYQVMKSPTAEKDEAAARREMIEP